MQLQKLMTLVWKVQRVLWEFRTGTTSIAQGIQGALLSGRGQDGVRSRRQLDNMKMAFQGGESSGQPSKNSRSVKELRISPYPTTVWGVLQVGWGCAATVIPRAGGGGTGSGKGVSGAGSSVPFPFLRLCPLHVCLFSWPPLGLPRVPGQRLGNHFILILCLLWAKSQ